MSGRKEKKRSGVKKNIKSPTLFFSSSSLCEEIKQKSCIKTNLPQHCLLAFVSLTFISFSSSTLFSFCRYHEYCNCKAKMEGDVDPIKIILKVKFVICYYFFFFSFIFLLN